jgi:hypothetical protein
VYPFSVITGSSGDLTRADRIQEKWDLHSLKENRRRLQDTPYVHPLCLTISHTEKGSAVNYLAFSNLAVIGISIYRCCLIAAYLYTHIFTEAQFFPVRIPFDSGMY